MTLLETTPATSHTDDDELGHIYCCRDENRGLCGALLDDVPGDGEADCIVCLDIEANGALFCPLGEPCRWWVS